jgi:hypothetical protein
MTEKLVVVISTDTPVGVALNTAALLGVALGRGHDEIVGPDTVDASGNKHAGMCTQPIPVLRASGERLHELRDQAAGRPDVAVHEMHQVAQQARTYEQMADTLAGTKPEDITYLGLGLHGPKKAIDSLVGALPLYR